MSEITAGRKKVTPTCYGPETARTDLVDRVAEPGQVIEAFSVDVGAYENCEYASAHFWPAQSMPTRSSSVARILYNVLQVSSSLTP